MANGVRPFVTVDPVTYALPDLVKTVLKSEILEEANSYTETGLSTKAEASSVYTKNEADTRYGSLAKANAPSRQSALLGTAFQKLRKGQAVKIVARGDSTTYGHDVTSSDIVGPPTTTLPDGSKHSFTRSPAPWPAVLQTNLNLVYSGVVSVENQGYSGDWVARGYDRWSSNVNADITLISYGINDASASYVPDEYRGNVAAYVAQLEKMILRDLAWGSAVIVLTSTRQRGASGNVDIDVFRNAAQSLCESLGVPLVDIEPFLLNANRDAWSDGNHLTTKGNSIFGARMTAVFVGEGPQSVHTVGAGSKLISHPTIDNLVLKNAAIGNSPGYRTPQDEIPGSGIATQITSALNDGVATWSFYTDAPDLVIFPIDYLQIANTSGEDGVTITYDLDFGVEQGDNYHDNIIENSAGTTPQLAPSPATVIRGPITTVMASFQSIPTSAAKVIRVSTPGWHTLRARFHRGNTANVSLVHAIEFFDYRVWQLRLGLDSIGTAIDRTGTMIVPVPASYNETTDITEARLNFTTLRASLGLTHGKSDFYKQPLLKIGLKTYALGLVEYLLLANPNTTDIAAKVVDSASSGETSNSITVLKKFRETSFTAGGTLPSAQAGARELASVSYSLASDELVLTLRTTNSADGTTPKNMKPNFVVTVSLF